MDRIDAVSIRRWIAFSDNRELYGFCDASEKVYRAAIYLRGVAQNGKIKVPLVMSKKKKTVDTQTIVVLGIAIGALVRDSS